MRSGKRGIGAAARQAKHAAFIVRKRLRPAGVVAHDAAARSYANVRPYRFDLERYRDPRGFFPFDFFLDREAPVGWVQPQPTVVPRVIYVVWSDSNPLTRNRQQALDTIRRSNEDVPVVLVTPANLADFVLADHPLHPSYEQLSAVHRSDYLRSYLMHHHGGGYTDLKRTARPWTPYFDRLDASTDTWILGYPEPSSDFCANLSGPLLRDMRRHYTALIGDTAFIARPGTPLTAEWRQEVERRMDYYSSSLAASPATDAYGTNPGYPVTWIGLQANVFHPVQLKYLSHVATEAGMQPSFDYYR